MKNNTLPINEQSLISTYIKEVEKIPLLSREEEYDLAVLAKQGDSAARNKLVEANSRFVISVAKKFQGRGLPLEDLISEGNIGLLTAVDKFEPEKGFHFISYAVWWIRQSIMKAIADKSRMVRLPVNRLDEAEKYSVDVCSLDVPVNEGDDTTIGDFIESPAIGPENEVLEKNLSESIDRILDGLSEREREIIMLRYGLRNHEQLSLKEVGDIYGLTKERIRQIEKNVIARISEDEFVQDLKYYIA